ncbi:MAG TPA: hypothetical protein VHE33_20785 [Acidobacteriaceae bacterium]|nr:hypothetical protein [Acidobacteriaceae bacterium]
MNTIAMAAWLSRNIPAIACDEASGELFRDVQNAVEAIERMINRPIPDRVLGPCPTLVAHHQECATQLTAPRHATEIVCPACDQTHSTEQLTERLFRQMEYRTFTIRELLDVVLPRLEEWVPRSTLYFWVAKKKLTSSSSNAEGEPLYLLSDVRKLRSAQPRTRQTS